jgi:urease alpha subunit
VITTVPTVSHHINGEWVASLNGREHIDHNPWTGIYAACTRRTELGRELDPAQRLTVDEALRSYTNAGAWIIGRDDDLGSLEPGKRADLVLLDEDPYTMPVDDLRHVVPSATMAAGVWARSRPSSPGGASPTTARSRWPRWSMPARSAPTWWRPSASTGCRQWD